MARGGACPERGSGQGGVTWHTDELFGWDAMQCILVRADLSILWRFFDCIGLCRFFHNLGPCPAKEFL